jgi:hypothetical protein
MKMMPPVRKNLFLECDSTLLKLQEHTIMTMVTLGSLECLAGDTT